ncbi:MAG: hypothetical protein GXP31_10285 [Kiritimatiellaeota bacterium]|nr:hypothetical protein [Kiritimatiellota bacterium]
MTGRIEEIRSQFDSVLAGQAPDVRVYPSSWASADGVLFCLARTRTGKRLFEITDNPGKLLPDLSSDVCRSGRLVWRQHVLSPATAAVLRRLFPWTAPVSLRRRRTTFGCGDRLGMATSGHLRAVAQFEAAPVLAQQSIRELALTHRTFPRVVDDVVHLVFQEGYRAGFGADGDHLKTLSDIDRAVDAGMTMITLDLSEVMTAEAEKWDAGRVAGAFAALPDGFRRHVSTAYADKRFAAGQTSILLSKLEVERCAVMYGRALEFAAEVYGHLRKRRGDEFDLELSIDETTAPTQPEHHLYIILELRRLGVELSSLAPRFVGEFQKAVDYIGDLAEFEKQFALHCAIAETHGGYKISVHSGSDKFSVYPTIGRCSDLCVHVKTAGTSWLEAVRTIAQSAPRLYRDLHRRAVEFFPEALAYYHVTPDLASIPNLDELPDAELPALMDHDDARQLLHVTYGGILPDPKLGPRFFAALEADESGYAANLERHFVRHLETLGVPRRTSHRL